MTGQRKSVKILGAIELFQTRFHYRQETVFNASTYLSFLEQLARRYRRQGAILIQDNASYHKDCDVWSWFGANRHWLEVHQLPPYSPEFNPTERLWQYTRRTGTLDGELSALPFRYRKSLLHTEVSVEVAWSTKLVTALGSEIICWVSKISSAIARIGRPVHQLCS